MNCNDVMDRVYEFEGNSSLPLFTRLRIWLHTLRCPRCAEKIEKLTAARSLMKENFFPPAPGLEDRIMQSIALEELEEEYPEIAGVSFRSWVVTGLVVLVSLSTSFLGMDFIKVADNWGSSFLLPIGITVGAIVSAYGALFIGSHLKELSDRFNLH
ncbi:peptidoglycan-binding protein [Treponema primitia]|uniref:peptidoglycan-binding protein n=1 Tax=Treponema primitia TaxID=88058 RepID=UPI0002555798|nr:peptidoglycan-binding protein [Treponema primitia]